MDQNYCLCSQQEFVVFCQICVPKEKQKDEQQCNCQLDCERKIPAEGILAKKLLGGLKPKILTGYKRQELLEKREQRRVKAKLLQEKLQNEKPSSISDEGSVHDAEDEQTESHHGDENKGNLAEGRALKSNQFSFDVSVKTRKIPGYGRKIGDQCNCQKELSSQPSTSSKESIIRTETFLTREKIPQASISFFEAYQ